MKAVVHSSTLAGLNAHPVKLEIDTSKSLPNIVIVGMASKSVDEAKERIRSAITNSSLSVPKQRITINMSPADLPKEGASFDLAMALGILLVSEQIEQAKLTGVAVIGELGLYGDVRPVKGVISHVLAAREQGLKKVIIPATNLDQASLVSGIELVPVTHLRELYLDMTGAIPLPKRLPRSKNIANEDYAIDFSDVIGQQSAKRALEIAAAGGHNLLMNGSPGGGKSMLAKALVTILPEMTLTELVEVTQLHSLAHSMMAIQRQRPFRSPHHSASHIALTGGGQSPLPGEISLAHHGVLFLDEVAEFPRQVLESMRQPLEDKQITIARAKGSITYPANCMVVATQNPCPCGYKGDPVHDCTCTVVQQINYAKRLSGPLLDRIDLHVLVERTEHRSLLGVGDGEPSSKIRQRVSKARNIQNKRQGQPNSMLSSRQIKKYCPLNKESTSLLNEAADKLGLTARGYMRTIKLARTIADIDQSEQITPSNLAEALQYRQIAEVTP